MKKNIKLLCLLLALVIFAGMALGSGSSTDENTTGNSTSNISGSTGGSSSATLPSITEQVIVDQDGIVITATEYVEDGIWGEGIKLLIENTSDKNVGVSCNATIVNNYMIVDLFSASVAAGKKANETLYLSSSELEAAGISNVGQIELYFHVYDSDSYDTLFDAPCAIIQTSEYDAMDTTSNDDGIELYNENGIRIVGKYVDENSFWGSAVLLYLENNSGNNVTVSCENMSVDGFMVTPYFYASIYDGKMAIEEITIFGSDLEENGITTIEELELSFHVYDSETYETIADTSPITITVN